MKKTYRIGVDVRLIDETGVGRYIRNLIENLALQDDANNYVLFAKRTDISRLEVLYKEKKWKITPVDIRWHSLSEQISFGKIIEKEKLDLMHFPYFSLPVRYNKPFVVTIHDLIIHHFSTGKASTLPFPLYHIKRIGYKKIISHAVNNATRIIVPLQAVKDDVIKTLGIPKDKIVVTTEGFDKNIHTESSNEKMDKIINEKKYFLFVGNAYPHKNLEKLIAAFQIFVKTADENTYLILVGKKDYFYQKLRTVFEKNRVNKIIFLDAISDTDLAYLYNHAICFISASLMEGFGLPALEAMELSCPVAVSDIKAFREVCKDAAYFFDPLRIEEITEAFQTMYSLTDQEREIYITKGKKQTAVFSWKKMAEETRKVYESSIGI